MSVDEKYPTFAIRAAFPDVYGTDVKNVSKMCHIFHNRLAFLLNDGIRTNTARYRLITSKKGFSLKRVPQEATTILISHQDFNHFQTWIAQAKNRRKLRGYPFLQFVKFVHDHPGITSVTFQSCHQVDAMMRRKCHGCRRMEIDTTTAITLSPHLSKLQQDLSVHHLILQDCTCRQVYYCGVECQRKHWNQHKVDHQSLFDKSKQDSLPNDYLMHFMVVCGFH
jgi:hypothetical protein